MPDRKRVRKHSDQGFARAGRGTDDKLHGDFMDDRMEQTSDIAANAWLALADAGDGAGSWSSAGAAFRAAVTPERWTEQHAAARGPLGALTSRVRAVEQRLDGLPGAPPGEYLVR